jgi:hypothetical protein
MKIALYIEEGFEQIVLTPETETETLILAKLDDETRSISIMSGSFFECRGGWMRNGTEDSSTMIVLRKKEASQ